MSSINPLSTDGNQLLKSFLEFIYICFSIKRFQMVHSYNILLLLSDDALAVEKVCEIFCCFFTILHFITRCLLICCDENTKL